MHKLFTFLVSLTVIASLAVAQESSPLIQAIEANNLSKVKTLVANGADVNDEDKFSRSAIYLAIGKGNINMVKFLVESGATDKEGLYEAVRQNDMELTKYLLQKDFRTGESMVYAAENNNLEMVKLLVSHGAKVDFSQKRRKGLFRKYYVSPIDKAVSHNNLEMVKIFVKEGVPVDEAILSALNSRKNDIVLYLSKDLEDKSWLLLEAFERSNDPIVKQLIAEGVPPNSEDENGNSMLLIAASNGELGKVKTCVEEFNLYLFKKNKEGENALMKAAKSGSLDVCTYLVEKGITVDAQNNKGETALFYALGKDAHLIFTFLLEKGANINHTSSDGNTLLLKAAMGNQVSAMKKLIDMGADLHHENKLEKNAFYYVVSNSYGFSSNSPEIQNTFLEAGADINTKGSSGESLLFKAVEKGDFERVMELINKGADANTQNHKGERPSCKETAMIKYLIENGADINAIDDWDNTFMCEAVKQNDLELAYYLVEKGIDLDKKCYFDE